MHHGCCDNTHLPFQKIMYENHPHKGAMFFPWHKSTKPENNMVEKPEKITCFNFCLAIFDKQSNLIYVIFVDLNYDH